MAQLTHYARTVGFIVGFALVVIGAGFCFRDPAASYETCGDRTQVRFESGPILIAAGLALVTWFS